MSEQSEKRNNGTRDHKKPGERLEKKTKPVLTAGQARKRAQLTLAAAEAKKQAQKKKEKRIMIVMIVLAVVMVIITVSVLLVKRWFVKPELPPGPGQTNNVTGSDDPGKDPNGDSSAEPTLDFDAIQPKVSGARKSKDIYTILIFGTDTVSGLTDTMMVATYDVTNQKATVMSLPRDTIVNNTGVRIPDKKLNAVYTLWGKGDSGVTALKNEVSELVGFVPDYYVKIEWELVGKMVDAIGGVWFDNPYHMEYEDYVQDLYIYQEKGYRKLSGDDAMQIVRWRHNGRGPDGKTIPGGGDGSDLTRLAVQHAFLKAVLKQTLQPQNIVRIPDLIRLFNENVVSDLAVENMLWFGQQAVLGGLQVDDVNFCTMPVAGGSYYQAKYNATYEFVYPIQSQLLTIINESLNPFVEQVTIRQLDLMYVAADGSLRSSTGRLADPSVGVVQARPTNEPTESGKPTESEEPMESGGPTESEEPQESGQPVQSGPPESEPPTAPPATEPPEPSQGLDEGDEAG